MEVDLIKAIRIFTVRHCQTRHQIEVIEAVLRRTWRDQIQLTGRGKLGTIMDVWLHHLTRLNLSWLEARNRLRISCIKFQVLTMHRVNCTETMTDVEGLRTHSCREQPLLVSRISTQLVLRQAAHCRWYRVDSLRSIKDSRASQGHRRLRTQIYSL
jgi:hypothetical protein